MSLSREAMMELMAYADGELEGEAKARAEELVRSNDEARRVVDAMRGIGDVVRELPEAHASERDAAASIADGVMAKLASEPRGTVVSLEAKRAARVRMTAITAVAIAIAAGVALYVRTNAPASSMVATDQPHESSPVIQPAPGASEPAPSPAASIAAATEKSDEVDLEEVESKDHNVSVFYVPKAITGATAQAGASSVVIWIDDHGGH